MPMSERVEYTEYKIVLPIPSRQPPGHIASLGDIFPAGFDMPLWCVAMPWFAISKYITYAQLSAEIASVTLGLSVTHISLISERPGIFQGKPVHFVVKEPELLQLHSDLYNILVRYNCAPQSTQGIAGSYYPYVYDRPKEIFPPGFRYNAKSILIVERDGLGNINVLEEQFF